MFRQETFSLISNDENELLENMVIVSIHKDPSPIGVQNRIIDHVHQNLLKPIWITNQFLR